MSSSCRICDNSTDNKVYTAREMMYGTFEKFDYIECGKCGCVQIKDYQDDISRHYPANYYSFSITHKKESILRILKKKTRAQVHFQEERIFKKLLAKALKPPKLNIGILNSKLNFNSRILDVGCGTGKLLFNLKAHGFKNLTGVDPYIQHDINELGISIIKTSVYTIKNKYDFIMLNHSFEHMEDPLKVLTHLQNIITKDGQILIRIPIASSYAWKHYSVNWVQLDPPRHYYLHTVKSIKKMALRSNLIVENIIYDSEAFQFIGSEFYKRNIPMPADVDTYLSTLKNIFTKKQIKNFDDQAVKLNEERRGDQACFYLKKRNPIK